MRRNPRRPAKMSMRPRRRESRTESCPDPRAAWIRPLFWRTCVELAWYWAFFWILGGPGRRPALECDSAEPSLHCSSPAHVCVSIASAFEPSSTQRLTTGFVTNRKCRWGAKNGPQIASNSVGAVRLIRYAADASKAAVTIDVAKSTVPLKALCSNSGLEETFQTARMYRRKG